MDSFLTPCHVIRHSITINSNISNIIAIRNLSLIQNVMNSMQYKCMLHNYYEALQKVECINILYVQLTEVTESERR